MRSINHYELRQKVSTYIQSIHTNCGAILEYKTLYIASHPTLTSERYYVEQSTHGNFADEIFIMATAVLIGFDVTSIVQIAIGYIL